MTSDSTQITELINQIHWLSAELKKRTALRSEQQRVLLASKGLLHTLAEQGPRTVPAIADARNTSRQNIQIIANRLAELGCIEFVPNPNHKKSDLVRLTQSGTALLKSSTKQENSVLEGIAARIGTAQLDVALDALNELRGVLCENIEMRGPATGREKNGAASGHHRAKADGSEGSGKSPVLAENPIIQPPDEPEEDDSLPVNLL